MVDLTELESKQAGCSGVQFGLIGVLFGFYKDSLKGAVDRGAVRLFQGALVGLGSVGGLRAFEIFY